MQVNIQNKNFTLLEIRGKVIGQDALVLKTMLEEHIQTLEAQDGTPTLIFNLANAESMDSAGLGVLITSSTQIRQSGGRTALVNVNKGIKRMLIRTKPDIPFRLSQEPRRSDSQEFLIGRNLAKRRKHYLLRIPRPICVATILQRVNQQIRHESIDIRRTPEP